MRAALLTAALVLLAAPAAHAQVDAAVGALQDDPVYVHPAAFGTLDEHDADALRDRIAEGDAGPVFVAVLPDDGDPPAEQRRQARAIADGVGRPGSYAVLIGTELWTGGNPGTEPARLRALAGYDGGGAAEMLGDFVDEVADGRAPPAQDDGGGGPSLLGLAGIAVAGGAVVAAVHRRRRRREEAAFAEVKDNARDDLVALGDDIRALELDVEMPGAPAAAREDYAAAVGAYERANRGFELAHGPADLEPVAAALEEGRWAMACARARLEGGRLPERRSPCFFNPRHGPSMRDVEWAPPYGTPRMVPACEDDARRVEEGDEPGDVREVLVGGRRTPYWDAGPAYAPLAAGYYGAGLLPGLMIGTALDPSPPPVELGGGDFGGGDFGGGDFGGGGFGGGDFGGG